MSSVLTLDTIAQQLRANQLFLVRELLQRGVAVEFLSEPDSILTATCGQHVEYLIEIDSSIMPYPAALLTEDKYLTKRILERGGLHVPRGAEFSYEQRFAAMEYALDLGGASALKPTRGTHGEEVFLPLEDIMEVNAAIEAFYAARGNSAFLIEEFFAGEEYRVFVTRRGDCAVLHREPAYVVGDGARSIEQLAADETDSRLNPRKGCLCEIVLDEAVNLFLSKSGRTLAAVPAKGEKVRLRANSNLKGGGVCEDATEIAHPSVAEICCRALACFPGMPYAGVDFMTTDIRAEQHAESYRIVEVNPVPTIAIHMNPAKGTPRNVAAWLVDMMFPETAGGRISKACAWAQSFERY